MSSTEESSQVTVVVEDVSTPEKPKPATIPCETPQVSEPLKARAKKRPGNSSSRRSRRRSRRSRLSRAGNISIASVEDESDDEYDEVIIRNVTILGLTAAIGM